MNVKGFRVTRASRPLRRPGEPARVTSADLTTPGKTGAAGGEAGPELVRWRIRDRDPDKLGKGVHYPPRDGAKRPPLVVLARGPGARGIPSPLVRFWNRRGFAVLDALGGRDCMGPDVDDLVAGALRLVQGGRADPQGVFVSGTTGGCLAAFRALVSRNVFRGGSLRNGEPTVPSVWGVLRLQTGKICERDPGDVHGATGPETMQP